MAPAKQASADDSDFSSGSDTSAPLPGEVDSEDDAETDGNSDSSQLQLPADNFFGSESDFTASDEASNSDEDMPLAAEQQGPASRQKPKVSVAQPRGKPQQQPPAGNGTDGAESNDQDDGDDSDSHEEELSARARRNSHQVDSASATSSFCVCVCK